MIKRAGETKRIKMYDGSDMSDSWQLNNSCANVGEYLRQQGRTQIPSVSFKT